MRVRVGELAELPAERDLRGVVQVLPAEEDDLVPVQRVAGSRSPAPVRGGVQMSMSVMSAPMCPATGRTPTVNTCRVS